MLQSCCSQSSSVVLTTQVKQEAGQPLFVVWNSCLSSFIIISQSLMWQRDKSCVIVNMCQLVLNILVASWMCYSGESNDTVPGCLSYCIYWCCSKCRKISICLRRLMVDLYIAEPVHSPLLCILPAVLEQPDLMDILRVRSLTLYYYYSICWWASMSCIL